MKLGIQGIHHVGMSVPDAKRAREFFVDLLGGVIEVPPISWQDNPYLDAIVGLRDSAADQFMCRFGNSHIEVFEYHSPRSESQDPDKGVHQYGYTHFALQVEDIAACYQRLVEAGIRVHTPPDLSAIVTHPDGSKTGWTCTYCRDYFGNVFEIMEIHDNDQMKRI